MLRLTGRWPSRMPFSRMTLRMPWRMASPSPPPRGSPASAMRANCCARASLPPLACRLTSALLPTARVLPHPPHALPHQPGHLHMGYAGKGMARQDGGDAPDKVKQCDTMTIRGGTTPCQPSAGQLSSGHGQCPLTGSWSPGANPAASWCSGAAIHRSVPSQRRLHTGNCNSFGRAAGSRCLQKRHTSIYLFWIFWSEASTYFTIQCLKIILVPSGLQLQSSTHRFFCHCLTLRRAACRQKNSRQSRPNRSASGP